LDSSISRDQHGLALRLLMQRDLFGLQNVLNIGVDSVWDRSDDNWNKDSAITLNYGIALPLDPNWTLSFELNNERGFDGLFPSWASKQSSDTYYVGPTIQYDCELVVVTFGVQAQLPWSSGSASDHGYTPDAERFRAVLRAAKSI